MIDSFQILDIIILSYGVQCSGVDTNDDIACVSARYVGALLCAGDDVYWKRHHRVRLRQKSWRIPNGIISLDISKMLPINDLILEIEITMSCNIFTFLFVVILDNSQYFHS